jgi:hypothetical protein
MSSDLEAATSNLSLADPDTGNLYGFIDKDK